MKGKPKLHLFYEYQLNNYLTVDSDGRWTIKNPVDGNKYLSLPKGICSEEVISSCLSKDLSAWQSSQNLRY